MKLLMENWRKYLKEETVDEIRNPFRKQDIGGPRKKKTKEADISFDVYKRFWEIHKESELIVAHLLRESDRVYYPKHPEVRERSTDLLLRWLPKAKDLFLDKIVPLLDQLYIVRRQIDELHLKWPKEMKSEEVFEYAREKGFLDGYETPLEQLDTLIRILLRDTSDLKLFYNRGWQYSDSLRDKLDPPKFPEPPSMNKLFKLINRAKGNDSSFVYPERPPRALTTTVDEVWNPFRRKQDIGGPKEKRNKKEAQISGEDFKDAKEIIETSSKYICILSSHPEAGDTASLSGPLCHDFGHLHPQWKKHNRVQFGLGYDIPDSTLSKILEKAIELYEKSLKPLLAKLIIALGQIENYGNRFPKELRHAGKAYDRLSKSIEALENHRNALLGLYRRLHGVAGLPKYTPKPGIYDLQKLRQHAEHPDLETPKRWARDRKTTNLFSGSPDED